MDKLIEALDKAAELAAIENRRDLANHLRGCVVALLMQAEPKAPARRRPERYRNR
jgi:hypothetical protein